MVVSDVYLKNEKLMDYVITLSWNSPEKSGQIHDESQIEELIVWQTKKIMLLYQHATWKNY
jgi:hypothetical protein